MEERDLLVEGAARRMRAGFTVALHTALFPRHGTVYYIIATHLVSLTYFDSSVRTIDAFKKINVVNGEGVGTSTVVMSKGGKNVRSSWLYLSGISPSALPKLIRLRWDALMSLASRPPFSM